MSTFHGCNNMLVALLWVGCDRQRATDDSPASAATAATAAPSTAVAATSAASSEAPDEAITEAAYEEQAESDVATDNLESQIAKLEKELGSP